MLGFGQLVQLTLLLAAIGEVVESKRLSTTEILSACECQKSVPICDFYEFSKKKLKQIIGTLQVKSIDCDADGTPTLDGEYARPSAPRTTSTTTALEALQLQRSGTQQSSAIWVRGSLVERSEDGCVINSNTTIGCNLPDKGLQYLFPTFLLEHNLITDSQSREHVIKIKDIMLDLESKEEGCKFNLHGGYRSQDAFLSRNEPSVKWLRSEIDKRVKLLLTQVDASDVEYTFDGWGAVLRNGHGQALHVHPASVFAGVFYAAMPEEVGRNGNAGCLHLVDPRIGVDMIQEMPGNKINIYGRNSSYDVCGSTGSLLMFPSWLMHEVRPMLDSMDWGPRVGISFNVDLKARYEGIAV